MPTRQETLDQLRQYLGDENCQRLIDSMGGEEQVWKQFQKAASAPSSGRSSPSPATGKLTQSTHSPKTTSSSTGGKATRVVIWLAGIVLLGGLALLLPGGLAERQSDSGRYNEYPATFWDGIADVWKFIGSDADSELAQTAPGPLAQASFAVDSTRF